MLPNDYNPRLGETPRQTQLTSGMVFPKSFPVKWTGEEGLNIEKGHWSPLPAQDQQTKTAHLFTLKSMPRTERQEATLISSPPHAEGLKTQLLKNSNLNSTLKMDPISLKIYHSLLPSSLLLPVSHTSPAHMTSISCTEFFLYIRISFCAL